MAFFQGQISTTIDENRLSSPWCPLVIFFASIAAIFLLQESVLLQAAGVAIVGGLAAATLVSPWLGVLALFPLALSVAVPPPAIGTKEAAFAVMTGTVIAVASFNAVRNDGIRKFLRDFGLALTLAGAFFAINFLAAVHENVSFSDWLRGAVPYAFLLLFVPISIGLRNHPDRLRWLGASIACAALLSCGYTIGYYIAHRMWQTYWYVKINGDLVRVSQDMVQTSKLDASGPFVDRITMVLPSSTDTLITLGVSLGIVIAILGDNMRQRIFGIVMTAAAILAILIGYTRSMLLSPFIAVGLLLVYVAIYRRDRLRFMLTLLAGLILYMVIGIQSLGLGQIWFGRTALLFDVARQSLTPQPKQPEPSHESTGDKPHSVLQIDTSLPKQKAEKIHPTSDDNVNARIDEYRIAWSMFLDHPFIGNGLGKRHPITFIRNAGEELHESVGYVHNWPLYTLMAGGIIGFLAYAMLLLWPAITVRADILTTMSLRIAMATLMLYGLFFAVARLITFNLLVAAAWGIIWGLKDRKLAA
jgi:O-antigen ligase/polysaccharide polymerase Wzy-like membrane protein